MCSWGGSVYIEEVETEDWIGEWRTIEDSENLEYDLFDFSTKYEH
jgi:hypothetical protein